MTIIFILFFILLIGVGTLLWINKSLLLHIFPTVSIKTFKYLSLGYIVLGLIFVFLSNNQTYALIGLSLAGLYSAGIALFLGLKS